MKKLIALLLAAVMMGCMLCACGNSDETEPQQTTSAEVETNPTETGDEIDAEDDGILAACEAMLGGSVDLSLYDEPDVDEDSVDIYLTGGKSNSFDYTLTLSQGASLNLAGVTTYQDLVDAGWTSSLGETADALSRYINNCSDADGHWFTICLANVTDGAAPMGESFVTGVTIQTNYIGDFDVNGITPSSTVADVIAAFGNPWNIYYSETMGLQLEYKDDINGSLEFDFDESGAIYQVAYDYSVYNLF